MNKKYRKAIIAGNWKMNKTASEVGVFVDALKAAMSPERRCETVLCAPFPLIPALGRSVKGSHISIGAQDVSEHEMGAYTGEVSAEMLQDLNVKYSIVGHSERRRYLGETDQQVNAKARTLLSCGLTPIICVGEDLEQRRRDLTHEHISYQVKAALYGVTEQEIRHCIIAYEPIWAIGTGETATGEQAQEICSAIRMEIRKQYGARLARSVSILYGGSMNAGNAAALLAMPDIDGGLIGGASLNAAEFAKIIKTAGELTDE